MSIQDHIEAARKRIAKNQNAIEMLEQGEFTMGRNGKDFGPEWAETLREYVAQDEKLIEYFKGLE